MPIPTFPYTLGPYTVHSIIGEGGCAVVYRATHTILNNEYALKILKPEITKHDSWVERFLREARHTASLNHPNIVPVVHADVFEGLYCIAMQYLDCENLDDIFEREAPLSLPRALHYTLQIARALEHAHEHALVHRDVKPGNILITKDHTAYLTDFGIVHALSPKVRGMERSPSSLEPISMDDELLGTPLFMSPEQWENKTTTRSDLYALGVTLYALLTKTFPFDGQDPFDIFQAQHQTEPPEIRSIRPDVPEPVSRFIHTAIQVDPQKRYQSAREMIQALEPCIHNHPFNTQQHPTNPTPFETMTHPAKLTTKDFLQPVEIAPDTFWVGRRTPESVFFANPYLRLFRNPNDPQKIAFSVLTDPGSSSDFAVVRSKVHKLIGNLSNLSLVFINHQDPDVVSSATTLLNRFATQATIMTSNETWRLIVHGNLPKDRCVFTDSYPNGFTLDTGHALIPVPSPFCHFVGATMLYDPQTQVLFSGDLFGGLTPNHATGFLATEEDWTGIRAFHQLYMPSNTALRRAVDNIRKLDPPVRMIAPQHGRILTGDLMHDFMDRIAHLPVGLDNLDERIDDASTLPAWNVVLQRVLQYARDLAATEPTHILHNDRLLRHDLSFENGQVRIKHLGKSTLERVVNTLCGTFDEETAHILQYEAILAAEELELPVPRITIEEVDEHHVGAPLPFA